MCVYIYIYIYIYIFTHSLVGVAHETAMAASVKP